MSEADLIFQQPWVTRTGWTLVHFLWQGSVVAIVLAAARTLAGRRLHARSRYALSCAALAVMTAAPLVTFLAAGSVSALDLPRPLWPVAGAAWDRALPWLVLAWSAGVVVFSLRIALGWRTASRMRQAALGSVPPAWQQAFEELKWRMGVTAPARMLSSSLATVPAVVGWLRPVILVPVEAMTGMPLEQVRALLAHEPAHVLRQDYLVNILQSMAEALLFYHPAVWWVSNQIRLERELCCDDLAVAASGDVLAYATALAGLDSYRRARFRVAQAANGGSLLHRIRRLAGESEPRARNLPGLIAVCVLVLLWMTGVGAAVLHAGPHAPAPIARFALRPFVAAAAASVRPVLLDPPLRIRAPRVQPMLSALLFDPFFAPPPAPVAPAGTASAVDRQLASVSGAVAGNSEIPASNWTAPLSPAVAPVVAEPLANPDPTPPVAVSKLCPAPLPPRPLVEVNIVATDAEGATAEGLNAADFRAWDNGTEQTIASVMKITSVAASAPSTLPPNTYSNRIGKAGQPQVLSMVLLDAVNTRFRNQAEAWRALENIVEQLQPEERVAIYTLGSGSGIHTVQDFSADRASLLTRLKAYRRGMPGSADALHDLGLMETAHPGLSRPAAGPLPNTLKALEAIADHVKGLPGRKNLLWVSAAFPQIFGDRGAVYSAQSGSLYFPVASANQYPVYPAKFGPQLVPLWNQRPVNAIRS